MSGYGQPPRNPVMEELLERMKPESAMQREILDALRRIEEKLSPTKSAILTGPEVKRVFSELAKHRGAA